MADRENVSIILLNSYSSTSHRLVVLDMPTASIAGLLELVELVLVFCMTICGFFLLTTLVLGSCC